MTLIRQSILQTLILLSVIGLFLFLPAGSLRWGMGWAVTAIYLIGTLFTTLLLAYYRPALAGERAARAKNVKSWDIWITTSVKVLSLPVLLFLAGIDYRFGLSPVFPLGVQIGALIVFALGFALIGWSMFSNPFFAASARIQAERWHRVTASGPYRFVRHPGYAGMIAQFLSAPLALGSLIALVPGLAAALLFVLRTVLEDRMLQDELYGYRAYTDQVRYLLISGLW